MVLSQRTLLDMGNSSLSRLSALRGRSQDLNEAERQQALKLAEDVIRELEPPESRIMRYAYQVCLHDLQMS
jgi:hypothetical protein